MRFADTSFWIGLQVSKDRRHADAAELWKQDRVPIRTTELVLGETWTYLTRKADHRTAVAFVERVRASNRVSFADVSNELHRRAWEWLLRHDERVYSFVDATSFEVMRSERITEALAFDGDFSAAGFVEARPR